jgi:hypothetical protein
MHPSHPRRDMFPGSIQRASSSTSSELLESASFGDATEASISGSQVAPGMSSTMIVLVSTYQFLTHTSTLAPRRTNVFACNAPL